MDRRMFIKVGPAAAAAIWAAGTSTVAVGQTAELKTIDLVKPEMDGGKSVLAALKLRQTNRNIKPEPLSAQELSNLLWAAFGINREQLRGGKSGRTAASASNSQEIDLYVALPEGVYVYDAAGHKLVPVVAGDLRSRAGRRGAATAPVNIFFVVDLAKFASAPFQEPGLKDSDIQKSYYFTGVGLIAGNIYLYAASAGLAAWFHNCDKENAHKELKLRPDQRVLFAQTVGHPA